MEIEQSKQSNRPPMKNILMLLVSLALGGAGVYLAQEFIDDKVSFYRSQMDVKEELVELVVPKQNMLRGEVVLSQNVSLRKFPKKYMDSNAVTSANYKVAIGQRLNFDIDGGKPLLWAHLEGGLMPTFSGKIEDGYRALTIPVDEINSISGFLQPKDNVDLMLTYKKSARQGIVTFPFMQNLHVLATGVKTMIDKTGRASSQRYSTITVQVTPENAKKIILAQDVGKITATLRHPDDLVPMSTKETKVSDLMIKKPKKKYKRAIKKKGIEFIIGGV